MVDGLMVDGLALVALVAHSPLPSSTPQAERFLMTITLFYTMTFTAPHLLRLQSKLLCMSEQLFLIMLTLESLVSSMESPPQMWPEISDSSSVS